MKHKKEYFTGLADLSDGNGNKINLLDFAKKEPEPITKEVQKTIISNSLPDAYKGKNWDDLYQSDELETIRKNHPNHYEKLKTEKYKKID